ncbi:MAG: T9SS type A sorting domain-containing protein [Fibrobacterota bacterium]
MFASFILLLVSTICFAELDSNKIIFPEDLQYLGAFRPPSGTGEESWSYGGGGLTFYPEGDSEGSGDGFPGSLFGIAHIWYENVSEMSIPAPVKSSTQDIGDLPRAESLQPYVDITEGKGDETPPSPYSETDKMGDLCYLPAQPGQTSGKIYWSRHYYYQVSGGETATLGWSETDLSNLNAKGPWHGGPVDSGFFKGTYTGDYLFTAPKAWADSLLGGKYIIGGRSYGPGNHSQSSGPAMIAYGPYLNNDGAAPAPYTEIDAEILLMYPPLDTFFKDPEGNGWGHCDKWQAGVWLTEGERSVVMFMGRRGLGETYYGNGRDFDCKSSKGYHCTPYEVQFLFYDPSEFGAVIRGEKSYKDVQPFAIYRPEGEIWDACSPEIASVAYDRQNGHIYMYQSMGGDVLIHVYRIIPSDPSPAIESGIPVTGGSPAIIASPNPFNPSTIITVSGLPVSAYAETHGIEGLWIYDSRGRIVARPNNVGRYGSSSQQYVWDASGMPAGIYIARFSFRDKVFTKKLVLTK